MSDRGGGSYLETVAAGLAELEAEAARGEGPAIEDEVLACVDGTATAATIARRACVPVATVERVTARLVKAGRLEWEACGRSGVVFALPRPSMRPVERPAAPWPIATTKSRTVEEAVMASEPTEPTEAQPGMTCPECSAPVPPSLGNRPRIFCSKRCRVRRANREHNARKAGRPRQPDPDPEPDAVPVRPVADEVRPPSAPVAPSVAVESDLKRDALAWLSQGVSLARAALDRLARALEAP